MSEIEQTGLWYEPAYWREPGYLAEGPWSILEVELAFMALQRIYTAAAVSDIFARRDRRLLQHFMLTWSPRLCDFLQLGFDALLARPWRRRQLLERLRIGAEYEGARFEVRVWAAFLRSGTAVEYEPLRDRPGPNPDFLVPVADGVYLDVKAPRESAKDAEESAWFQQISNLFDPAVPPMSIEFEVTDEYDRVLRSNRRFIETSRARLAEAVRAAKLRLAVSTTYPTEEHVEGLFVIRALAPPGPGGGSYLGSAYDAGREADRIVAGCLSDGAAQLPRDRPGIVLIRLSYRTSVEDVKAEIQRWFREEGVPYRHLVGVMLLSDQAFADPPFELLVPVWREKAPRDVRGSDVWPRLARALNVRQLVVSRWERDLVAARCRER